MAAPIPPSAVEKPEIDTVDHICDEVPEKAPEARVIDSFYVLGLTDEDVEFYENYTEEQRNKTMRKVSCQLHVNEKTSLTGLLDRHSSHTYACASLPHLPS